MAHDGLQLKSRDHPPPTIDIGQLHSGVHMVPVRSYLDLSRLIISMTMIATVHVEFCFCRMDYIHTCNKHSATAIQGHSQLMMSIYSCY